MRALVTGAAGFIGSTLSEALLAAGHEVVGIDCFLDYYPRAVKERNLEAARANDRYRFVEDDLVTANLDALLEGVDYVFHQAAQAGVRSSWGEEFRIYSDNNIFATQRLLEACRKRPLRKLVYASSSSVYGDTTDLPMRETGMPRPVSPYGVSKLAAEHLVWLYHISYGLPTVSLRYFTVYGPRQRPDMAFHRFINSVAADKPIVLYGDGEQSRDFTFVEDIVRANIAAAEGKIAGAVLNIGGGSRTTVNEVIATIGHILGKTPQVDRREVQRGDVRHTAADMSAAQRAIGFAPQVQLADGLARQAAWQTGAQGLTTP
ncbi:MAG TPA: NAD-dependent epimerase/dehydratase family protein [Candidatus Limnocylindrales bacterium]|nr:NAD-dependent epimerase/dehydratase family protein [Candidatus Limnocylindrales bacterium]